MPTEAARTSAPSAPTGTAPTAPSSDSRSVGNTAGVDALLAAALGFAALAEETAELGERITAARSRRQWHGNAPLAIDDEQFRRVLGAARGRATVSSATAEALRLRAERGELDEESAAAAVVGLAELSRLSIRSVFDTVGASATLAGQGLDGLWRRQHAAEAAGGIAALTLRVAPGV
ncbi:MAG: hypothetical protein ACTH9T_04545 [Mycetocola reblochoni]|uniref:Uncharacterized protein n=2 Tax=Mycetocola reblochoni TaxID=331618 RepID=A0A1R4IX97_9MICO|nr:hypothetical protein [Mycetocola reblochoni]RLP70917.1 hypothetical protein D9V30_00330 [Mycetocola reblochoni]SJN24541.1 hypothetical protein FM119_04305 [Mycetocola reblochoni REB411]